MIAIIPAKKKSKRLPGKNIKLLFGKPLIAYAIKASLKAKGITRTIVSTDCAKIAKISKKYGAEIPFLRPKSLAADSVEKFDVCKHAINFLEKKEKKKIESVIVLQPTSPLTSPEDIDKAIWYLNRLKKRYKEIHK